LETVEAAFGLDLHNLHTLFLHRLSLTAPAVSRGNLNKRARRRKAAILEWCMLHCQSLLADLPMCTHNSEQAALQDCFSGLCLRDDWHDPWKTALQGVL